MHLGLTGNVSKAQTDRSWRNCSRSIGSVELDRSTLDGRNGLNLVEVLGKKDEALFEVLCRSGDRSGGIVWYTHHCFIDELHCGLSSKKSP